jgi:hypothetical protein
MSIFRTALSDIIDLLNYLLDPSEVTWVDLAERSTVHGVMELIEMKPNIGYSVKRPL